MKRVVLGVLLWIGLAAGANAHSQEPVPQIQVIPAVPGEEIPLGQVETQLPDNEEWIRAVGQVWVRNVSHPALYRVAPKNGRGNGRAVIVVPGGGFSFVSIESEGFWVAERLAAEGYTAFVLKYRPRATPQSAEAFMARIWAEWAGLGEEDPDTLRHRPAVVDLADAVTLVHRRADEWSLDRNSIGVIGFSAGALASMQLIEEFDAASLIDNVALIYPPTTQVVEGGPRPDLFMAISNDDPLFEAGKLLLIEEWLHESNAVEFHLYSGGGHGFGMRPQGTTSDYWIDQYVNWLETLPFPDNED